MKYIIAIDGPRDQLHYLCNYSVCARVISQTSFTRDIDAAPRFDDFEHAAFIAGHQGNFFLGHIADLFVLSVPA